MDIEKLIIQLIGGVGLFLYGMRLMGDGLENSAGDRLKDILEKVTKRPIIAVGVGAIITAIIQSSSATIIMVVGFVNVGLISLMQATWIIMGANIGTTITTQLFTFRLEYIAPILVGIGAIAVLFTKGRKRRGIEHVVLGFGMLFMGMGLMTNALRPIAHTSEFNNIILAVGDKWIIGIFIGFCLTAVVQSSAATTGILIALAGTDQISINIAIPILFGCNIGTCVTTLISSIGTSKKARKAAFIHLIYNVMGTIIFIPLMGTLAKIVVNINPDNVGRQIANAHLIFNIVNTVILLPLTKYLIMIVEKLIPGEDELKIIGPKFIDDRLLETPVIAAGQVIKETIRMANTARMNLEIAMEAFINKDEKLVKSVYENEKIINNLEEEITRFLVLLSKCDLSDKESAIVSSTFHIVNDIERIGDHAENIVELASKRILKNIQYSEESLGELKNIYNYTLTALKVAIESYAIGDFRKAESVNDLEVRIDESFRIYSKNHIRRLNNDRCTAYAGVVFMDLLSNFERIGDHSVNIAGIVIENASV
ncbi:Na/Pi cotransporter family protein [Clostridium cellulovorans]|uniref:Na/Pi-cotransporter II-related protein n=1 Tax=Clostridium cellulovorans (strain ATCC 35296 / DSM 3052 / OCM 3 / 743B) TaxID=573061 RepID=D9SMN2_CLOC7|nr:Na/Pi cotransporter family protein [Clostridium cellulovorans]ADL49817.1 Na/Pi-cotransporter II-related protein [Clostridium cellulovorans 743B]